MTGKKNVSLPCAVGSTSYIDTVKNSYYVDKTLLIRDLIDDHAAAHCLPDQEDLEKHWQLIC